MKSQATGSERLECACRMHRCMLCGARMAALAGPQLICEIRGLIQKRHFESGEYLCLEGERRGLLHFLTEGMAKVTVTLPDGREQILRLALPGQPIGLETLEDETSPYAVQALTPVATCTIRVPEIREVLQSSPDLAVRVIRALNEELAHARVLVRDLGLMRAGERVASFLLSLLPAAGADEGIPMPLSRAEIAEMLGLTPETVSRHMARLKRERVIREARGRLHLLDTARLRALAGLEGRRAGAH